MSTTHLRPRKAPRQERSRATVERILDAAARIFDELGYRATTTNDIADEAGVSVGSLYQYFPNKDSLLVALAERHVAEVSSAVAAYLAQVEATHPDLDTVITDFVGLVVDLHELDGLHLLLAHRAPRTPELQAKLDELLQIVVDAVGDLLAQHDPDQHDLDRHDPVLTARLLVAMVDAAVHDVILRQQDPSDRRAAVERTIAMVRSILLA